MSTRIKPISPVPWITISWVATATIGLGLISLAAPARPHDSQTLAQPIPVEARVQALAERVATLEAEVRELRGDKVASVAYHIGD